VTDAGTSRYDLDITRVLDAPRSLVFQAWTDPKMLAQWWGPQGFTNPRCEADARASGGIRIDMKGPDGNVYPMDGMFEEVVPPERLVFTTAPLDDKGKRPFRTRVTATFEDVDGRTKLMLQVRVIEIFDPIAERYLSGMNQGWNQSLDRLAAFVAKR
jgi:uncharacterized protein YndB with AHSA1/START domain